MWRVLADVNHARRVLLAGERGSLALASRRIGRALLRPKHSVKDFQTILDIEARYGFRSTFFVLHDRYWARQGARFRISDPDIHAIADLIKDRGCEIGLHGGYYRFNDPGAYRESREVLEEAFCVEVTGIRNHLLRFSGEDTWNAQLEAGFSYDATFGDQTRPGPRDGCDRPFWAIEPAEPSHRGLIELPLTVMDGSLFRYHRLGGEEALEAAWQTISVVVESGGLVTLLWHGNYFNEPEYWDWQWVYEELVHRLAALNPWCATGGEIDWWWRTRNSQEGGS
jgi:peptidoglycan/xylan/chitin deacetylase (PgdA/CDA1 family)